MHKHYSSLKAASLAKFWGEWSNDYGSSIYQDDGDGDKKELPITRWNETQAPRKMGMGMVLMAAVLVVLVVMGVIW